MAVTHPATPHMGVAVTWNREVSRIFYEHCVACHRPDGESFSLMSFEDAQPRAAEIRDAVLSRRMPPWGAVQGFGQFDNDMGLTQAQIDLINDWVQQGRRRGNNPNALPMPPLRFEASEDSSSDITITVTNGAALSRPVVLVGLLPRPDGAEVSGRIVAVLPDGQIEPLVWLYEYAAEFDHPFLFREPLDLPADTTILGIPDDCAVDLILARHAP